MDDNRPAAWGNRQLSAVEKVDGIPDIGSRRDVHADGQVVDEIEATPTRGSAMPFVDDPAIAA